MNEIANKEKTLNDLIKTRRNRGKYILARELSEFLGYNQYNDFLPILNIAIENSCKPNEHHHFRRLPEIVDFRDFDDNLGDRIEINPDFIKVRKKVKAGVSFRYKYDYELSLQGALLCIQFADKLKPKVIESLINIVRLIEQLKFEVENPKPENSREHKAISWQEQRDMLKEENKTLSSLFKLLGAKTSEHYQQCFNSFYRGLYNMVKSDLCILRGISEKVNYLDEVCRAELNFIYASRDTTLEKYRVLGSPSWNIEQICAFIYKCARDYRNATYISPETKWQCPNAKKGLE